MPRLRSVPPEADAAEPRPASRRARLGRVVIVTPALADANNGNWHTARRWAAFLRGQWAVSVQRAWDGTRADAMIALHARRSADSVARWAAQPDAARRLAVVLTGTDLHHDVAADAGAQRSLASAGTLVLLSERGAERLPVAMRHKICTILPSMPPRAPLAPRARTFDLALVGHLRAEKDPMTAVRALARLHDPRLRLRHVGGMHADPSGAMLVQAMREAAARDARIELLGPRPHAQARREIRRTRVLLLTSITEGGPTVVVEAVAGGTPVLATRIDGAVGLLGEDYPGYFPVGDDAALAGLIARCRDDAGFLQRLRDACAARAPRFAPERERQSVRALARRLQPPQ